MNDPGCTLMQCESFKDGVCHYDSDTCKYRRFEADDETIKDAERFQWLISRGVAWRGCYKDDWMQGEWLYGHLGGREEVDKAMKTT